MIELDGVEWATAEEAAGEEKPRPGERRRRHGLLGPDVKPSRVRDWKRRGFVAGYRVRGITYYRLDDLLAAELRTRLGSTRPRDEAVDERVCEAATV